MMTVVIAILALIAAIGAILAQILLKPKTFSYGTDVFSINEDETILGDWVHLPWTIKTEGASDVNLNDNGDIVIGTGIYYFTFSIHVKTMGDTNPNLLVALVGDGPKGDVYMESQEYSPGQNDSWVSISGMVNITKEQETLLLMAKLPRGVVSPELTGLSITQLR